MTRMAMTWHGMDAFRAALRNLPPSMTAEADHILQDAANGAAFTMRTRYGEHRVTGKLQASVRVDAIRGGGRFATGWRVRVGAAHAHLFEFGTQVRHKRSGASTGRMFSTTPHQPVAIPTLRRFRAASLQALKAMLVRQGLLVTGNG